MTVRDLISELQCYDDNMEVVMNATNSCFVDETSGVAIKEIYRWHVDIAVKNMLIIMSNKQIGTMIVKRIISLGIGG